MLKGLDPIVGNDPQVMILGSMPSVSSLAMQEYYGFKHNRFWKIMSKHYGCTLDFYEQKRKLIIDHHILLWDVIGECERVGSLDSAIHHEKVNDIEQMITRYPSIHSILCNGKKSYDLFMKHFGSYSEQLSIQYLPSTSNANRSITEDCLFELWEANLPK